MRSTKNISIKNTRMDIFLMIILSLLSIGITYLISTNGKTSAVLIIVGIIGILGAFICLRYPETGFYFPIIFSFFLFDIQRFLQSSAPLGMAVDILIYLTFLGIIIQKIQKKEIFWKHCSHPIVFVYIIIFLYGIIELFNPMGAPLNAIFPIFRRFITLMIFFYCCIQLFSDEQSIYRFLKVYFFLAVIAALYACYQEWLGYPAYEMRSILSNPIGERLLSMDNGKYRKFSFFASPADFGLLMSACALILIVFILNYKLQRKIKWLFGGALVLMLLAMSYSGTRTATLMLVIGIVLYILMNLTNWKTMIFAGLASVVFIFLIYGPIYGNSTINRLRTAFDVSKDESAKVRDVNRHRIQPFIYKYPLGGGLGTSGFGSSKIVPDHPLADFPSDSGLLRNAIEYGWIGALILYVTYLVVLQQGIHAFYRSPNRKNKILLIAAVVGLFGYMVAQYAQVAIGMIPGSFLVYALIAIIIRIRQIDISLSN